MDDERRRILAALADYDVGEELGRGRCGVVLSGRHRHLDREVAIKALPAAFSADPDVRARFVSEARVLAAMNHPHIVPIYDYVEHEGLCLLMMQKLAGGSVWSHFKTQAAGTETACAVLLATCAGLEYAHKRGVLHRDVKPENLLYSEPRVIKITDFGVAKIVGGSQTLATKAGVVLGTASYIAPEQVTGDDLGPPADVYAAGVMLYQLLSGQLPYRSDGGSLAVVHRHVSERPIPLEQVAPAVGTRLVAVTMRALARWPGDRYPTAEAFGLAIGEAATGDLGAGWLDRAELDIIDSGPIGASATHRAPGPVAAVAPARPVPPAAAVAPGPVAAVAPVRPAPAAVAPARPVPAAAVEPGWPEGPERPAPASGPSAPIFPPSVDEVRPFGLMALALVLGLLAIAVAYLGVGAPQRPGGLPAGVRVGGPDGLVAAAVPLDLRAAIPIELRGDATGATDAQVVVSVASVTIAKSTIVSLRAAAGEKRASVDMTWSRYLIGGNVTAELRLTKGQQTVARHRFAARLAQPAWLTVIGLFTAVVLIIVVTYAESLIRQIGRRPMGSSGLAGIVFCGLAVGPEVVAIRWLLEGPQPRATTVVMSVASGLGAGVVAAMAARRLGQRAAA